MHTQRMSVVRGIATMDQVDRAEAAELEHFNRSVARRMKQQNREKLLQEQQQENERVLRQLADCKAELRAERQDRAKAREDAERTVVSIIGLISAIGCVIGGVPVLGLGPAVMAAWVLRKCM